MKTGQTRQTVGRLLRRPALAVPVASGVLVLSAAAAYGGTSLGEDDGETDDADETVAEESSEQDATAFADCMRENGLDDFPDVTISDDGRIVLDISEGGIDPFSDEYHDALQECRSELPEGVDLGHGPSRPGHPGSPEDRIEDGDCVPPHGPDAPAAPELRHPGR